MPAQKLPYPFAILSGRLVRAAGGTFLIRGGSTLLALAISIALARGLGPEGFGVYSFALAVLTVTAIPVQFGLPSLLIREVSRARAEGAQWRIHDLLRWAHRVTLTIGIPTLILLLAAVLIPGGPVPPDKSQLLLAGAILVLVLPLRALRSGLIRGMDRVVTSELIGQIVQPLLMLLAVGVLMLAPGTVGLPEGLTPYTAILAYAGAATLAWLLGGLVMRRLLRGTERKHDEHYVVPGWRGALVAFGLTHAMVLIEQQVGLLVLGVTSPDAAAGYYKVASQAAMVTAMGYIAANMALGPGVAQNWHAGKRGVVQAALVRGSRLATLFAFPATLFFLVGGGVFLELVFGSEFLPAWPAMALLVGGQIVNCAFGSSTTLLLMSGHEGENTKAFAVALAVNVALAFALAPRFGATGAAAAAAASVVLRNLILWRAAHRLCGMETGFWGKVPKAG